MWKWQKKKYMFLFISFTFSLLCFYRFYKIVLLDQTHENCLIRNENLSILEKKCSKIVDAYFIKHSKEMSLVPETTFPKWHLMASGTYAYSAFYEKCPTFLHQSYCIKFVGIALYDSGSVSPFTSTLPCAFKTEEDIYKSLTVIEFLPERHYKPYTAAYFYCPIISYVIPSHASFYDNSSNLHWLNVEHHKFLRDNRKFNASSSVNHPFDLLQNSLNLCVRPFYNSLNILQLIEFLSYYSIMGVDAFIFYYTKSFKKLDVLRSLGNISNLNIDILSWDIPLGNDLIHEYGQIAFTQDCLSRSKHQFKHTIIADVDEYIMPHVHEDIKEMIQFLGSKYKMAGSYIIPMALFCSEYMNINNYFYPLHILNHRKRQKTTWLHHYRSKYILRPDRVRYSGVHFAWEFDDGYHEVQISPEIALINHYRTCCGVGQSWFLHLFEFKVLHDAMVTDNSMLNYLNKLLNHPLSRIVSNITASVSHTNSS